MKQWSGKRYYSLNHHLREVHGEKVGKVSLDGGFSCPNRDGTLGMRGCIFCSEDGSGAFSGLILSQKSSNREEMFEIEKTIHKQINEQKIVQTQKWPVKKFIAYFQNYTNTYGSLDKLHRLYNAALSKPEICGLAVATRPDCLEDEILSLLSDYNKQTHLWIELGLQTIHKESAEFIRRGYALSVFERAVEALRKREIDVVVHVILGIPGETRQEMLETISYLAKMDIQGIKIHLLHVIENTDLHEVYKRKVFDVLSKEEYIDLVVEVLQRLPDNIVIHRLTGDGAKESLIAPRWPLNKRAVLNGIDKRLKQRDAWQSKLFV